MIGPTERQLMALRFIGACIDGRQRPPTLREIGKYMSIRSTNGVNDHLRALERKGYIRREDMTACAIVLTTKGREAITAACEFREALEIKREVCAALPSSFQCRRSA